MQEEVENRTLTLAVNGTKFSGRLLKAAVCTTMSLNASSRFITEGREAFLTF